jgi:hypothetical protein
VQENQTVTSWLSFIDRSFDGDARPLKEVSMALTL